MKHGTQHNRFYASEKTRCIFPIRILADSLTRPFQYKNISTSIKILHKIISHISSKPNIGRIRRKEK